jgi:hypothetical protein
MFTDEIVAGSLCGLQLAVNLSRAFAAAGLLGYDFIRLS